MVLRFKYVKIIDLFITVTVMALTAFCLPIYGVTAAIASGSAIYHIDTEEKYVCLMFNVYGGTEYLESIMDTLDSAGADATFFVGGVWAEKNTGTLAAVAERGFCIGNHGYYHKDHKKLSEEANREEIENTNEIIYEQTGLSVSLFAPPSGSFSEVTLKASRDLNMYLIMWSKDTIDWRDHDTALIVKRATKNPKGGDFILMHPTKNTAEALPAIVAYYAAEGYKMISVETALSKSGLSLAG